MPIKASILIPTRNAGEKFEEVLEKIFAQRKVNFEVRIIDTESNDETLRTAKKFPAIIKKINKKEFGHGKARNTLAKEAKGKYLVFITQDAVPKNDLWLYNLLKGFNKKDVAGTYGRQLPLEKAFPMENYFYLKKYGGERIEWNASNWKEENVVYSSVNCAVRKELFEKEPFSEEVIVSEDYEWAYRIMNKGHRIVYEPKAEVIHSHNYSLINLFKRHFDIGYSYSQIYSTYDSKGFVAAGMKFYLNTLKYLLAEKYYSWIPYSIAYGLVKFLGVFTGKKGKYLPKKIREMLSNQKHYWENEK